MLALAALVLARAGVLLLVTAGVLVAGLPRVIMAMARTRCWLLPRVIGAMVRRPWLSPYRRMGQHEEHHNDQQGPVKSGCC